MPSATIPTTVATGTRSERMHGTPPIWSASTVIRRYGTPPSRRSGGSVPAECTTPECRMSRALIGVTGPVSDGQAQRPVLTKGGGVRSQSERGGPLSSLTRTDLNCRSTRTRRAPASLASRRRRLRTGRKGMSVGRQVDLPPSEARSSPAGPQRRETRLSHLSAWLRRWFWRRSAAPG